MVVLPFIAPGKFMLFRDCKSLYCNAYINVSRGITTTALERLQKDFGCTTIFQSTEYTRKEFLKIR
jgi:hypothetical protein